MMPRSVQLLLLTALVSLFLLGAGPARAENGVGGSTEGKQGADASSRSDHRPNLDAATEAVVERTNAFRHKQNLAPLEVDADLTRTAQHFARYMAKTGRYGHRLNGSGPAERAGSHGYDYCIIAENIGRQFDSRGFSTERLVSGFVEGWKKSPGHRKNMVAPNVTEIGVGIARSEDSGYYYAVQLFGRPRSAMFSFELKNETDTTVDYSVGDESFRLPPRYRRTHRLCQPEPVRVEWSSERETATRNPRGGEAYRIVRGDDGRFQLQGR